MTTTESNWSYMMLIFKNSKNNLLHILPGQLSALERRTLQSEKELQGQKVLYLPNFHAKGVDSIQTSIGQFYYVMLEDFQTYPDVKILTEQTPINSKAGEPFDVRIEFVFALHL